MRYIELDFQCMRRVQFIIASETKFSACRRLRFAAGFRVEAHRSKFPSTMQVFESESNLPFPGNGKTAALGGGDETLTAEPPPPKRPTPGCEPHPVGFCKHWTPNLHWRGELARVLQDHRYAQCCAAPDCACVRFSVCGSRCLV